MGRQPSGWPALEALTLGTASAATLAANATSLDEMAQKGTIGGLRVMKGLSRQGMSIPLITHEIAFTRSAVSRAVYFHKGRIHEQGSPQTFLGAPQTPALRHFPGAIL